MWKRLKKKCLTKLVSWHIISEPKWKKLDKSKFSSYLYDNHPDRQWYIDYLLTSGFNKIGEVGAGAMWEIRELKKLGKLSSLHYTVIDIAREFMAEGEKLFPEVAFHVDDIQKTVKLPAATFDITYCRSVLEHQSYYQKPLEELHRLTADQAIINLFRWSLNGDRIEREKYWSNAYDVHKLLKYAKNLFADLDYFLVYRQDGGVPNLYEDEKIRRTGDHLVIVGYKEKRPRVSPYDILDRLKIRHLREPFGAVQ